MTAAWQKLTTSVQLTSPTDYKCTEHKPMKASALQPSWYCPCLKKININRYTAWTSEHSQL